MSEKKHDIIDLGAFVRRIISKKKVFFKAWPITFVLACLWILPEPRFYKCEVLLAPEMTGEDLAGGLSSLASSFGVNIGGGQSDAIYPELYPDLMQSNEFIVSLFDIDVKNEDGDVNTDYYTYLTKYQKHNFITKPFLDAKRWVTKMLSSKPKAGPGDGTKINPFQLSEFDYFLVERLKNNIICTVDKKTAVVSIIVKDQDRIICASIADSIRLRLQDFITQYRTSKARLDVEHYQCLTDSTRLAYEMSVDEYSRFCDSHKDAVLQAYISERDLLENDMQLKYNTYSAMCTQLEAMKAKVQERTPAFTVLNAASVPVEPAGPKRMLFVIGMLFLVTIGIGIWLVRDIVFGQKDESENPLSDEDA